MQNEQTKKKRIHLTSTGKVIVVVSLLVIAFLLWLIITLVVTGVRSIVPAWNPAIDVLSSFSEKAVESENGQFELNNKEKKLTNNPEKKMEFFASELDNVKNKYINGEYSYAEVQKILTAYSSFKGIEKLTNDLKTVADEIEYGREALVLARAAEDAGRPLVAFENYSKISRNDSLNYPTAQKKLAETADIILPEFEDKISERLAKYELDEALLYIGGFENVLPAEVIAAQKKRVEDYRAFSTDTEIYSGNIEHVFTHCLIAFPSLCYSSPSMTKALDTDCITPSEFLKILQNLYEKGYILIDINNLYTNENGVDKISMPEVPKGKKPLVLSIDDVTYDSRKAHTGMVDKLMLDGNGNVCTYTLQDGKEIISYDNEVFPIVNSFVREHPDFSFRGARGMLCNTGFDGVFGYRTQSEPCGDENGIDREAEISEAKKIAASLHDEGWYFASHGFNHSWMASLSYNSVKSDTDLWQNEVVPIIGETKVMVWPYGDSIRKGESHKYLYDTGFRIFCGVGSKPYIAREPDGMGIFMDRKALDGYSLRNRRESYMYLFDTYEVWDELRPKEVTW